MNFLNSYQIVLWVKLVSVILCRLPNFLSLRIGRFLGRILFLVNFKAKRIAYANLRLAFSHKFSPSELKKISRKVFEHMGSNIVEVLRFPVLDEKYMEKHVKIFGLQNIEQSLAAHRGVVLLTAHFGNWELSAQASSMKGFPMLVLATEQRHSRLNELLNNYRSLHGCQVITKGLQLREILRGLGRNKIVGILGDQDGGKNGFEVDFFGKSVMMPSGPFEIAVRNNSKILPCFNVRQRNGDHSIYVGEAMSAEGTENKQAVLENQMREFNRLLEEKIIEFPEQWLWTLKRWKSSKERSMVVLSDGKAGHLTQSGAVAEAIIEGLSNNGFRVAGDYRSKKAGYKIIEVKFKDNVRRIFFELVMPFWGWFRKGGFKILKFVLQKESFLKLQSCYADIFISAGSGLAGINLLMAAENLAKSVVVMRPPLPLKWFNLAVVPRHDLKKCAADNVVETLGAAVSMNPAFIKEKAAQYKNKAGLKHEGHISLFFGGETPFFTYDKNQVKKVVAAVKKAAACLGAGILVTTSRRSPGWLEDLLEKEFSADNRCEILIIAGKSNMPNAVAIFLGLSRVAIVSGESVSMVSEAASTDRQVIVFMPAKKKSAYTKQERLISEMETEGYLVCAEENLEKQIVDLFSRGPRNKIISNKERIKEAAKFLI